MEDNKEKKLATITELMSREAAVSKNVSSHYTKQESVNENLSGNDEKKNFIEITSQLRQQDMLIAGSRLSANYNDEYRRIKRPLLSNAFGKTAQLVNRGNLIMVTSAIPGEGKTHTAINLALSIAKERDHTVLLVDCDVNRHGCSRLMGLSDMSGLVEILESDSIAVGDVILRTDVPELCLLPSGRQHDYVTELLASQRMEEIVEEIRTRYDDRIIIFDAPPLLPTPQTTVLAGLVGQVVFVIEAGKTPQALVEEALSMIPKDQATGIVMNKSEGLSSRGNYYYGYNASYKDEES